VKVPFTVQSYTHESLPVSAQRVVNWYAEQQPPEAKTQAALLPRPALKLLSNVGFGPIRGAHEMNEELYAVSGSQLFKVDRSGVATLKGSVGQNTTGLVSMADNGFELVIINDNTGFIYNRNLDSLVQISDPDFPEVNSVVQLDGYHIYPKLNSDQWVTSALRDATSYDALQFATAEGDPDTLLNIHVDHRQLLLMGRRSIEPWYNSGEDFPFSPVSGAFIEVGLGAKHAFASIDNTTFWLSDERVVYRLNGFAPQRVSTHAIEQAILGFSIGDARAFGLRWKGHAFFVLTFPDQATFVYDAATGLWSEWETYGQKGWIGCCHVKVYGKDIVGDQREGKLYTLEDDLYEDDGNPIQRIATGSPYYAAGEWAFMPFFEAVFESGVGLTGQESPRAMLQYSNDGRTWSNEIWRDIGKQGEFQRRTVWRRLGRFRDRLIRLTVSDPVAARLIGANAEFVGSGE